MYRTISVMFSINLKWAANALHLNTPFIQKIDQYLKKFQQDSDAAVMLILCLKQVEGFILKFPINGSFCWGRQIFNALYIVHFFPSGGGVYDVLVRFSLIEQIIKNYNLMCIQCQISTDILGFVNEFPQYVQNYFQYVYVPV